MPVLASSSIQVSRGPIFKVKVQLPLGIFRIRFSMRLVSWRSLDRKDDEERTALETEKIFENLREQTVSARISHTGLQKHAKMSVFHDEVEIEDFEYDEETETYYYPCPCGDRFEITKVSRNQRLSCDKLKLF